MTVWRRLGVAQGSLARTDVPFGYMPNPTKKVLIRRVAPADLPSLVALNRAAYPDLILDEVVWTEQQLHAHLDVFPQGQLVAEDSSFRCVGAISTLIVPSGIDPLAPHTWVGITDGGYFSGHDPQGDTLYLADVYVEPTMCGQGIGSALYRALRDLCRDLRLRRVVAGGRLWGYTDVAAHMSAHEYVEKVRAGELHDRVLVSQLRAGFSVRGLLPGYLHDWRSRHWATLLEWTNPDDPRSQQDFAVNMAKTAPAIAARRT